MVITDCCCDFPCLETFNAYTNTTEVMGYVGEEGTLRDPYPRPSGDACAVGVTCGGVGDKACGTWYGDWPAVGTNDHNTQVATGAKVTFDLCAYGWKAVRARKTWHGRQPFGWADNCVRHVLDASCNCDQRDLVSSPNATRYLKCERTVDWSFDDGGGGTSVVSISNTGTVNRNSGRRIITAEQTLVENGVLQPDGWQYATGTPGVMFVLSTINVDCNGIFDCGGSPLVGLVDYLSAANGNVPDDGPGGADWSVSTSWSATSISYSGSISYSTGASESWSIEVTLSNPYTATELVSEVTAMLAAWNLADHAQLPWRTDADCGYLPMVVRDESESVVNPDPAGFTSGGDTGPYPTGDLLGAPNPTGYTAHFQFTIKQYSGDLSDLALACLRAYGAWGSLPHATYWTNEVERFLDQDRGAYIKFESSSQLTMQKWAETIMPWPARNVTRACGVNGDEYLDPDHTYIARKWEFDFRIPGEVDRLHLQWQLCGDCYAEPPLANPSDALTDFQCSAPTFTQPGNGRWFIAAFSPNGETFPTGGTNHGWGTAVIDDVYNGYWVGLIDQAIPDPYYVCRRPEPDPEDPPPDIPLVTVKCADWGTSASLDCFYNFVSTWPPA